MLDHVCEGPLHVHEPKTRGRGGDPTDPEQCLAICAFAHRWVHAHPVQAAEVGLLVHSWE